MTDSWAQLVIGWSTVWAGHHVLLAVVALLPYTGSKLCQVQNGQTCAKDFAGFTSNGGNLLFICIYVHVQYFPHNRITLSIYLLLVVFPHVHKNRQIINA